MKRRRSVRACCDIEALLGEHGDLPDPVLIDSKRAVEFLSRIESTLEMEHESAFDWNAMRAATEYLAKKAEHPHKVWLIVRTDRNVARTRFENGIERDMNAPDTSQREGKIARELSLGHRPALMLLRQNGREDHGWRACPFWWPVLLTPKQMKPVIFTSDLSEDAVDTDAEDSL
jgi:hypothetical protein